MKTTILLEVEHSKPLPADHVGSVERHFYTWAYAKGCEVDVTAKVRTCTFPSCRCPMDPGPEPDWCALGLPHIAHGVKGLPE